MESYRQRALRFGAFGVLTALGCGDAGCGACGSDEYIFPDPSTRPDALVQEGIAQIRLTQSFLDFVRPQLPDLLRRALAGQGGVTVDGNGILRAPLPPARLFNIGVAEADVRRGEALLWLDDLESRVELRFEPPNQVRLVMRNLRVGVDARLRGELIGSDFSCPITGNLGPGPVRHAAEITIEAVIDPGATPRPDQRLDVRVTAGDPRVEDLELRVRGSSAYCAESECRDCFLNVFGTCLDPGGRCAECTIACGGIASAAASLAGAFIDVLRPILNGAVQPIVEGFVRQAVGALNGEPARLERPIDLAELLGLEALAGARPVGTYVGLAAGRFPVRDRGGLGMEIAVNGGFEAELAECATGVPDFSPESSPLPELSGTDPDGRPYHLAATVAESFVDHILYALHRSGTLCLSLSTEDIQSLTNGSFVLDASVLSLLAADLQDLAAGAAPVLVELRPRHPGDVTFGSGAETGVDGAGNPTYDWLLQLGLRGLGVGFYVLVQDRYVRLFEVTADVLVGLSVVVLPDNRLELALGELRVDGFEEVFNELLPDADFAAVLPTLVELVLGSVLSEPLTLDVDISSSVSQALGGAPIGLEINGIARDGPGEDFLTVSATFSSASAYLARANTLARVHDHPELLEAYPGAVAQALGSAEALRPSGRIRLVVGEEQTSSVPSDLEYQMRVDGGMWSIFLRPGPNRELSLAHPRLAMPGAHVVEVRARVAGAYRTLDLTPTAFPVIVDPIAPTVSARWAADGLEVRVRDGQTPDPRALSLEVELGDEPPSPRELEPWSDREARALLPFSPLAGRRLRLVAVDGAGNRSAPLVLDAPSTLPAAAPAQDPSSPSGGCAGLGRSPRGGPSLVVLALAALALRLQATLTTRWGLSRSRRTRRDRRA